MHRYIVREFVANRSLYVKPSTRSLSECVLQFFHRRSRPCACFDLLWNNAIYGPLFTEVCLLYIRANAPTMGPVVSTSRSQLSVIASRKTRRRNFCKWSHSLSTAEVLWDGEQSATRLLLASANSLKAMIQPSILQNGTFKNPICPGTISR